MLDSGRKLHGVANGVTATGEIRVLINEGERVFNSADISLRKLSGKIKLGNTESC